MKKIQVTKYVCEVCGKEFSNPEAAKEHEERCKAIEKERRKREAEEKKWIKKGHSIWHEDGVMKHAPRVNPKKFGPHSYDPGGTSNCFHGCGCWMGAWRSGGKVDPFGACPNNPKIKENNEK